MSDLRTLIADLEGGALPAFGLEQRIHEAITGRPCDGVAPPPYLCSVNAAFLLLPANHAWEVGGDERPGCWARVFARWPHRAPAAHIHAVHRAATPATALAIAALKARMAEEPTNA